MERTRQKENTELHLRRLYWLIGLNSIYIEQRANRKVNIAVWFLLCSCAIEMTNIKPIQTVQNKVLRNIMI